MANSQKKTVDRDELIRKIDFFEALEPWLVKKVASVCIPRYYSKGDYVIRQGDIGLGVFFIVRGRFQVEIEEEGTTQAVAVLKEEQVFGELAVVDNQPRSANVVCLEEESECLLLTRDRCLKLMNKYPQVAIQMARALSQRLRQTDEMLVDEIVRSGARKTGSGAAVQTSRPENPSEGPPQPASGDGPEAAPVGTKGRIQEALVGTFNRLYTIKAMTRFSMAVIGCPVEVCPAESSPGMVCTAIGEVKIAFLPVQEESRIVLKGNGTGTYRMSLLQPSSSPGEVSSHRVCRGRVRPDDRLTVRVPGKGGTPVLTHETEAEQTQVRFSSVPGQP